MTFLEIIKAKIGIETYAQLEKEGGWAIDRASGKTRVPHTPILRVRVLTFLLPVFMPRIQHDLFLHEQVT